MSGMDFVSCACYASTLVVGLVTGCFVGGRIPNRRQANEIVAAGVSMDPDLARDIEGAAASWAQANGRPELSDLLASKVKLAWELRYGDDQGGW